MFTDPMEELCLLGTISLRQAMRLAVLNAPTKFTNTEEIVQSHLATYKHPGGYDKLPDYVKHWVEKALIGVRASQSPAHA